MKALLREQLHALEAKGLRRALKTVRSAQGREIELDGLRCLNFCSNDYLGLAADPRLARAAAAAMDKRGFGAGASRLVCGNFDEHEVLEKDIAKAKHTAAALVFSSGYAANAGAIPALVGRGDAVYSDRLNHASIVDGIILSRADLRRYPHNDANALEDMLRRDTSARRKLIVTDTVFSMDGDMAPLKDLSALARKYGAWFMVDEAHAFGVFGPAGAGCVAREGLQAEVDVQMGTLSKALGASGAYVAGSAELKDVLLNGARRFICSTAIPPSLAAAARCALAIMQEESWRREKLLQNASRLREGLARAGFDTMQSCTPIIPVMVKDAARALALSKELFARGIFVSAIRPPTVPAGTARLRVTVTAAHTEEDIARCLEAFRHAG